MTTICATFACLQPVDLILCEFDALNHAPDKQDLARVAHAVSRALRPSGYFYFDVNNRLAFEVVWPGAWFTESPGVALVMHGGYDRGITDIEWFLREDAMWRRHHEHIEQVAWTPAEMRRTLRAAGFDRIRAFYAVPFHGRYQNPPRLP